MSHNHRALFFVLTVSFICAIKMLAPDDAKGLAGEVASTQNQNEQIKKSIQHIIFAANAREAQNAYKVLFKLAQGDNLRLLTEGGHDGIAIRAAWEQIRSRLHDSNKNAIEQVGAQRLHRFLGYLEGRLRLLPAARPMNPFWCRAL
jgi:hypothetical protein